MNTREKLSPHFTLGELIRSDTAARKGIDNTPDGATALKLKRLCEEILEPVRNHYGIPFTPNSGYRSPELNAEIGGSARSQHCLGEAVDLEVPGISNFDLAQWIEQNLEYDQLILECYKPGEPSSGWVHVSLKAAPESNRQVTLTYTDRKYLNGLIA